ncbi:MAG TPA: hypothetical protein DEB09_01875, partial [Candidatus Magasanikbacteria bacterium]|nr:hypothetical protein [Candidatus Magasanikbacteria bacterium]
MSFTLKGKIYHIAKEYLFISLAVLFVGAIGLLLPQLYGNKLEQAKTTGLPNGEVAYPFEFYSIDPGSFSSSSVLVYLEPVIESEAATGTYTLYDGGNFVESVSTAVDISGDLGKPTGTVWSVNFNTVIVTATQQIDVNIGEVYLLTSSTIYSGSEGALLLAGDSTAPVLSSLSVTPATDGTGDVVVNFTVDDADQDDVTVSIWYEECPGECTFDDDGGVTEFGAMINTTAVESLYGVISPDYDPAQTPEKAEQLPLITTASGANVVTSTWFSLSDLPIGDGIYRIYLTAYDHNGSLPTENAEVVSTTVVIDNVDPTVPGDLSVNTVDTNSITLNLPSTTSTDSNFLDYTISYSTSSPITGDIEWMSDNDPNLADSNFNGATTTVVTGLSASTTYYFQLFAWDTYDNSTSSLEISSTTLVDGGEGEPPAGYDLPTVSTDAKTKLLWVNDVYYYAFSSSTGSDYNVYLTTSTNGGAGTWSEPQLIFASVKPTVGGPQIDNGLFAFEYNSFGNYFGVVAFASSTFGAGGTYEVWFASSTDALSWSATSTVASGLPSSDAERQIYMDFSSQEEFVGVIVKSTFGANYKVYYSTSTGSSWDNSGALTFETDTYPVSLGFGISGIGVSRQFHTAYYGTSGNFDIIYASSTDNVGTSWTTTTVASNVSINLPGIGDVRFSYLNSFTLDDNGLPGLIYYDITTSTVDYHTTSSLIYVKRGSNGVWTPETIADDVSITLVSHYYFEPANLTFYDTDKPIIFTSESNLYPTAIVNTSSQWSGIFEGGSAMGDFTELSSAYDTTNELWAGSYVTADGQLYFVTSSLALSVAPPGGGENSVCLNGVCSYNTITSAFTAATSGDTVTVSSTYVSSTESFPLTLPAGVTLDCQNSGAVIQYSTTSTITLGASSTIRNCSFRDVGIYVNGQGVEVTSSTFTLYNSTSINGGMGSLLGVGVGNMIFSSNTVDVYLTTDTSGLMHVSGDNNTVSNNTIIYRSTPVDDFYATFYVQSGVNVMLNNNYIEFSTGFPSSSVGATGIFVTSFNDDIGVTIKNNTIDLGDCDPNGTGCGGIDVGNSGSSTTTLYSVTSTYNFIKSSRLTNNSGNVTGLNLSNSSSSSVHVYEDYNAYYNLDINVDDQYPQGEVVDLTQGGHSLSDVNPYYQANGVDLVPFSPYLDINGDIDIGTFSGVRTSTIHIDDDGVIDYGVVDATSTSIITNLRSWDTVLIATGTYAGFTVNSSSLLSENLTITGAGAETIIDANSSGNGINLVGINSSTIQNLVVENAVTGSNSYAMNYHYFTYGGVDYWQVDLDAPTSGLFAFYGDGIDMGNPTELTWAVPGLEADLTSYVGNPRQDWNLGLADLGGIYGPAYFRADIFPDQATANTYLGNLGAPPLAVWVTSTFTVDGNGDYSFNASSLAEAGISVSSTSDTPTIIKTSIIDKNFTATQHPYDYASSSYNYGGSVQGAVFYWWGGGDWDGVSTNNQDISTHMNDANPGNWHLALISTSSYYLTYYINESAGYNTLEEEQAVWASMGYNLDYFATSTFTWSEENQEYTYHAPPAGEFDTPVATTSYQADQATPAINVTLNKYAGIKLDSSSNNIINVTSTGNTYGIWFSGTSDLNYMLNSVVTSSVEYDVYSDANKDEASGNIVYDSVLTTSSIFVTGTVPFLWGYSADVHVINDLDEDLAGVELIFTNDGTSKSRTTGANGYISEEQDPAYIPIGKKTSTTTYDWSSVTIEATATSTYLATSTIVSYNEPNQIFTLVMTESGGDSAPNPPTNPNNIVATSSIEFSWTDGSGNEDGFIVDKSTDGVSFVNVTTTIANVTSTIVFDLSPNGHYWLRVGAFNTSGTSAYVTSTDDYTNPVTPGIPDISNVSTSSVTATWSDNLNASGTVYYINYTGGFVTSTVTTTNITGLTPSNEYTFVVRAQYLSSSTLYTEYSASSTTSTLLSSDTLTVTGTVSYYDGLKNVTNATVLLLDSASTTIAVTTT